ncbi:hypothetical protein [Serratia sp. BW106]|uniref:hypothetical protein n=1 Tax=Serratia sp. BW106 TaxID=1884636 RepID=UPI0012FD868C|nr:hypothetical protein [Serratia sp. BW106]
MDSSENEQNSEKTNDSKDDTGVAVQIHSTFPREQVGGDEEGDTERRVNKHHDGGKDKAYSEHGRSHFYVRSLSEIFLKTS